MGGGVVERARRRGGGVARAGEGLLGRPQADGARAGARGGDADLAARPGGADGEDRVGVGVRAADRGAGPGLGVGEPDLEHEPALGAGGEEVLDGLRALPAGARGAHLRAEGDEGGLQVAARRLGPGRRAEVAADGGLGAHLEVRHAARGGRQRLGKALEPGHGRHRADGRAAARAQDARQAGPAEQERPPRIQPPVPDLRHDDRASGEHRDARPVTERRDRLLARPRGDDGRRLRRPLRLRHTTPSSSTSTPGETAYTSAAHRGATIIGSPRPTGWEEVRSPA
ncbi:MAG: hypothetical protein AVDCRST_MAG13-1241 [uncultured Solirubrobacteraceae bacterium]|uniref:Uncharacterized protein n=1 Tax=uncultured Solirubrobacteraceae bacterium TaxID=1162706 RepID=A0A6J4RU78_9ACTN|nr:MAG: hypothetical protein AVDCRST_MAG13-1241 [uncultured Solirubrobacteraceae bacterium]